MATISRVFEKITESTFFLLGPRGTGKSFWCKENYPTAYYIDLLDFEEFQKYIRNPSRLIELKEGNPSMKTFIIDEIQKIPELLDSVHLLIERDKKMQFILTGSSARKLRHQGINLLGGRALLCKMHPYMAFELGDTFNLNRALDIGLIPLIWHSETSEKQLYAYVNLYLKEEIQAEGLIRNLGAFSRFLESISFSHGSTLTIANISRECSVPRKTVEGYLSVLEDLLLGFQIPVFTQRAKRALVSHSKFYFFDNGVFKTLRPRGPMDNPVEIMGASLEGIICQHIKAWCDYSNGKHELFYWRTPSGVEVDFVVYGNSVFSAVEVKNSDKIRPEDLKGLKTFEEDYPEAKLYLLYRGKECLKKSNILCIPCDLFLKQLHPNSFVIL